MVSITHQRMKIPGDFCQYDSEDEALNTGVALNESSGKQHITPIGESNYSLPSAEGPVLEGQENDRVWVTNETSVLGNYSCSFKFCQERRSSHLVVCSACREHFCLKQWAEERRHDPENPNSASHRQIPVHIYEFVDKTLNANVKTHEQDLLHEADARSLWFGMTTEGGTSPQFINSDVYQDLISSSFHDRHQQFPSLASFVGPTGAGKSTLIKSLSKIGSLESGQESGERPFPTPVPGTIENLGAPASADVHLYADPATLDSSAPLLFIDCEGLDGGNHAPEAAKLRQILSKHGKKLFQYMRDFTPAGPQPVHPGPELTGAGMSSLQRKQLSPTPTRKFCVEDLYPRMLYSFSDVVCFVTQQANTAEVTLEKLIKWADKVSTKTLNQLALPCAIIVVNGIRNNPEDWLDEKVATELMLRNVKNMQIVDPEMRRIADAWSSPNRKLGSLEDIVKLYFDGIRVVYIPSKDNCAPDILYRQLQKLRNRILEETSRIQDKKNKSWSRLSAVELQIYFNSAFHHFSHFASQPFDFYTVSKSIRPPPEAFDQHISHLMGRMENYDLKNNRIGSLDDRIALIVASCISLAMLESPFKLNPDKVFDGDFRAQCAQAYKLHYENAHCAFQLDGKRCVNRVNSHIKGHQDINGEYLGPGEYQSPQDDYKLSSFLTLVRHRFRTQVEKISNYNHDPVEFSSATIREHRHTLAMEGQMWLSTYSNKTCFYCLMRHPDYTFPCQHAICERCVQIFGSEVEGEKDFFSFESCHLCLKSTMQGGRSWRIRLKPAGTGVRILCLDGGGIRGIISVKILEILERQIGLKIPIHQFFDLIVGTSTGGIITLGLGHNLWTASKCCEKFRNLAKNSFRYTPISRIPLLGWFFSDGIYRDEVIKRQLEAAFSADTLFGNRTSCASRDDTNDQKRALKVAVTATSCLTQEAVIMANYNRKEVKNGNKLCREDQPSLELQVWEAGRCTSAAPGIFSPYSTRNGQYQDGGLKNNNPVEVAISEAQLIWQSDYSLDLLVTVGTGFSKTPPPPQPGIYNVLPAFILRSINFFMNSLDSEKSWLRYQSGLADNEKARYHRLNMEMELLPQLDHTSKIDLLESKTADYFKQGTDAYSVLNNTAYSLVASLFYFEMSKLSKISEKSHSVDGLILCRLEHKYQVNLLGEIFIRKYVFRVNGKDIEIPHDSVATVREGGLFKMHISFTVADVGDKTTILLNVPRPRPELAASIDRTYHISGSPWPLNVLCSRQKPNGQACYTPF
ncbi:hypothetical protein BGZ60DRAFT_563027 [Tricladium varicosporioides]|nr:hypothetical protein BGZ60DRAFT_563027 [Hymenoscyphus varicosporioides]